MSVPEPADRFSTLQERFGWTGASLLMSPSPYVPPPVAPQIRLDPERPWLYDVIGRATPAEVSLELYGADISEFAQTEEVFGWGHDETRVRDKLLPDLLREPHKSRFNAAMAELLERDIARSKEILLDGSWSSYQGYLEFWASLCDTKTPSGESYFDAYLTRLEQARWYTDYWLTESARHPYLDLVYSVGGISAIEIIANHSQKYGAYRPLQIAMGDTAGAKLDVQLTPVDPKIIKRISDGIMDRLVGNTSGSDSTGIRRLLLALPPFGQQQVLEHFMARYGSNETSLWVFSRSGEPTRTHMLYWLFEDMDSGDRKQVAESFRASGLLSSEAIDSLLGGRTWAGRNLPWSTHKAQEAVEFWADRANKGSKIAYVMGSFAALWLPETAGTTITTLAGARVFPPVAKAFPRFGQAMMVVGTGVGAFQTTIALQEAISGRDVWSGAPMEFEDRLGKLIESVAGILLVTAGFWSAARLTPARTAPQTRVQAQLPPGNAPRLEMRVLSADKATGEFQVLFRDPATGQIAGLRGNILSGNATATNLSTGEILGTYRGGVFVPASAGALPPGTIAPVPSTAVPPTAMVPVATARPFVPVPYQAVATPGSSTALVCRAPPRPWMGAGLGGQVAPLAWSPRSPVLVPTYPRSSPPLALPGPPTTIGRALSPTSLDYIESRYGRAVRDMTVQAETQEDLNDIGLSLGGRRNVYIADVSEQAALDLRVARGQLVIRPRGTGTTPGMDLLAVTPGWPPELVVPEVKAGMSRSPYSIGRDALPVAYHDPAKFYAQIYEILKDPTHPIEVRARIKIALDEGRVRWELDAFGNVRVVVNGTNALPGDIIINVPIGVPP